MYGFKTKIYIKYHPMVQKRVSVPQRVQYQTLLPFQRHKKLYRLLSYHERLPLGEYIYI
jgi:hypothetical protein